MAPLLSCFALPAARRAGVAAAVLLGVALFAGAVRGMPLFLGGQAPLRLLPVVARGVVGVALETALFVAPSIGWALAAARLVDRGEARALFAIGVRPSGIVASAWPLALLLGAIAGLGAASWGAEAAAPGRAIQAWIDEARIACAAASKPAVVTVPLFDAAWVCLEQDAPRLVAWAPAGASAFAASRVDVSDDLRALDAADLEILVPHAGVSAASPSGSPVTVHVASASLGGFAPLGHPSNLRPWTRAALLGTSAALLASLAAAVVLRRSLRTGAPALALGALGPAAALLCFSALERVPSVTLAYLAVPAAGLGVLVVVSLAPARRR